MVNEKKLTPAPVLTPAPALTPKPQIKTRVVQMDFFDAMRKLASGKRIMRLSWSDPTDYGILKDGWLTIFTRGSFHTWKVNDGDLEGRDWVVIAEEKKDA